MIKIEPALWSSRLSREFIFLGNILFLFIIQILSTFRDHYLFNIIQIPNCVFNLLTWCYWFIRRRADNIGWHSFCAWSSPANLLTPDTGQTYNCAVKYWSASFQWGPQIYTKNAMLRARTISHAYWIQWCIDIFYLEPVGLRWYKSSLTTIHWPL